MGGIREVCPAEHTRCRVQVHWCRGWAHVSFFHDLIPCLDNAGLTAEALVKVLPKQSCVLAHRFVERGLVGNAHRSRGASKIEHPSERLPGSHLTEAAENGACCAQVFPLDGGCEEQFVHCEPVLTSVVPPAEQCQGIRFCEEEGSLSISASLLWNEGPHLQLARATDRTSIRDLQSPSHCGEPELESQSTRTLQPRDRASSPLRLARTSRAVSGLDL